MPRVAVDPASTLQFHVSSGGVLCLAARAKRASNRNASGKGLRESGRSKDSEITFCNGVLEHYENH